MDASDQLRDAFGVTEADLAVNRQGRLGPGQVRRLRRMAWINVAITVLVAGGLTAIVLVAADRPIQWWRWLLIAVLAGAVIAVGGRWVARLLLSARDGTVEHLAGPVTAYVAGRNGKQLEVQQMSFNLPIPLRRVVNGAAYDVWFTPRTLVVVAMEPIDTPPAG